MTPAPSDSHFKTHSWRRAIVAGGLAAACLGAVPLTLQAAQRGADRVAAPAVSQPVLCADCGSQAQARPDRVAWAEDGNLAGLELYGVPSSHRIEPNGIVTYSLHYTNTTDDLIPGVVLTASLSTGQSWNPGNLNPPFEADPPLPPGSFSLSNQDSDGHLRWSLGSLSPRAAGEIRIFARAGATPEPRATRPIRAIGASARIYSSQQAYIARETLAEALVVGPLLTLTKRSAEAVYPGHILPYTLTIRNLGILDKRPDSEPATGVAVADAIPDGTSLVKIGPGGRLDALNNEAAWHLVKPIDPGTTREVTFTVRADPALRLNQTIQNHAYRVRSSEMIEGEVTGKPNVRTQILPLVKATVETPLGRRSRAEAYPGQTITYTVTIVNPEPTPLNGLVVSVTLPADSVNDRPVSASFTFDRMVEGTGPTVAGRLLKFKNLSLEPWGDTRLVFTVRISPHVYTPNNFGVARYGLEHLSASHPQTQFRAVEDDADVHVLPYLRLTKRVWPDATQIRKELAYTLTLENLSPVNISGVVLTDTIRATTVGAPMSFTLASLTQGPPPVGPSNNFPLVWRNLTVAPGETLTIAYRAIADGRPVTYYDSDVRATAAAFYIPPAIGAARVYIESPVGFDKSVTPTETFLDTTVTYRTTLTNSDRRPYGLTYYSDSLPRGIQTTGGSGTYVMEFDPPETIAPGANWVTEYTARVGDGIECSQLPTARRNPTRSIDVRLAEYPGLSFRNRPELALLRIVPHVSTHVTATREVVLAGEPVTYTIHLVNRSSSDASGRNVQLTLPRGFDYLGRVSGPQPTIAGDLENGRTVTFANVRVPPGSALMLVFRARASEVPGDYTARVEDTAGGRVCVQKAVGVAPVKVVARVTDILELQKTVIGPRDVPPGSPVEFKIAIVNHDRDPFVLTELTDTLPQGFELLSVDPASSGSPGTPERPDPRRLVWRDVVVDGNSTRAWNVRTRAPVLFGEYTNALDAVSAALPISPTTALPVNVIPQVIVTKVAAKKEVRRGEVFSYTITVVNNSGRNLAGIRITDTLPAPFTFLRTISAGDTTITTGEGNRQPAWSVRVNAGDRKHVVFLVETAADAPGAWYTNKVHGWHPDVVMPNVEDAAPVFILAPFATHTPVGTPPASPTSVGTPATPSPTFSSSPGGTAPAETPGNPTAIPSSSQTPDGGTPPASPTAFGSATPPGTSAPGSPSPTGTQTAPGDSPSPTRTAVPTQGTSDAPTADPTTATLTPPTPSTPGGSDGTPNTPPSPTAPGEGTSTLGPRGFTIYLPNCRTTSRAAYRGFG